MVQERMSRDDGSSVRVAVRIRPLTDAEQCDNVPECIQVVPGTRQIVVGGSGEKAFTFDFAFPKDTVQETIYDECVAQLLEAFFEGFNATILAYGQTGSGKTFTMGSGGGRVTEDEQGIIPRVINNMFTLLADAVAQQPNVSCSVRCQFLEIYGEDVRDLLDATSTVVLREAPGGGVRVHGAVEAAVTTVAEMEALLARGSRMRVTGKTNMNDESSRSHAIFTVLLEQRIRPPPAPAAAAAAAGLGPTPAGEAPGGEAVAAASTGSEHQHVESIDDVEIRRSKFHFVDLAGSERAKRTGASGQRFKEGVEINKGLLTLGNVISALGDDTKRGRTHVPYRDSKLTRMLQDSLGGNSQTLMICCVSPADPNLHESLSALRYANRARNIQNTPVLNRDHNSAIIAELRQRVAALAAELIRVREGDGGGGVSSSSDPTRGGGQQNGSSDALSAEALREMASATPSKLLRPPSSYMLAAGGAGGGSGGSGAGSASGFAALKELPALRARAAEAEAALRQAMEDLKRQRLAAEVAADRLATVSAERDLLHMRLAEAGKGADGGSVTAESLRALDEAAAASVAADDNAAVPVLLPMAAAREGDDAALGLLRDLHLRISKLQAQLRDSEGQRSRLEYQLVSTTALVPGAAPIGHPWRRHLSSASGDSGAMAAAAEAAEGSDAAAVDETPAVVDQAHERLRLDRERWSRLKEQLGLGGAPGGDGSSGGGGGMAGAATALAADGAPANANAGDAGDSGTLASGDADAASFANGELDDGSAAAEEAGDDSSTVAAATASAAMQKQHEELKQREQLLALELTELESDIALKEGLMAELVRGKQDMAAMQQHYEARLADMNAEIQRMETDRTLLVSQLARLEAEKEEADTTADVADGSKKAEAAAQLRRQLQEHDEKMTTAKGRQRELKSLAQGSTKREVEVKALESEIQRMKKARVDLARELERHKRNQQELLLQKAKEIKGLKREVAKDHAEMKKIEGAKNRAEAAARRHLEELVMLRRMHRQRLGVGRSTKLTPEDRRRKAQLDEQVAELARRQEAADRLAAEYEKKLVLLQQKENLELVRTSLTSRRSGRGRDRGVSVGWGGGSASSAGSLTPGHAGGATASFAAQIGGSSDSGAVRETLEGALSAGGLSPEEEDTLAEVEERMESTLEQLKLKDERIASMEVEARANVAAAAGGASRRLSTGGGGGGEADLAENLQGDASTLPAAHQTIRVLFSSLMQARRSGKGLADTNRDLKAKLEEAQLAQEMTGEQLRAEKRMFDQRLARQARDFDEKLSGIINHTTIKNLIEAAPPGGRDGAAEPGKGTSTAAVPVMPPDAKEQYDMLLKMSNERNSALRDTLHRTQKDLGGAERRISEMEATQRLERQKRRDAHDFIEFELQSLRVQHERLRLKYENALKALKDAPMTANGPGRGNGGSNDGEGAAGESRSVPTSPLRLLGSRAAYLSDNGDAASARSDDGGYNDEYDDDDDVALNGVAKDLAAIKQGIVPESMKMVLSMHDRLMAEAAEAAAEGGEADSKPPRNVFERLCEVTTISHRVKHDDAAPRAQRFRPRDRARTSTPPSIDLPRDTSQLPLPGTDGSVNPALPPPPPPALAGQATDDGSDGRGGSGGGTRPLSVFDRLHDRNNFPQSAKQKLSAPGTSRGSLHVHRPKLAASHGLSAHAHDANADGDDGSVNNNNNNNGGGGGGGASPTAGGDGAHNSGSRPASGSLAVRSVSIPLGGSSSSSLGRVEVLQLERNRSDSQSSATSYALGGSRAPSPLAGDGSAGGGGGGPATMRGGGGSTASTLLTAAVAGRRRGTARESPREADGVLSRRYAQSTEAERNRLSNLRQASRPPAEKSVERSNSVSNGSSSGNIGNSQIAAGTAPGERPDRFLRRSSSSELIVAGPKDELA